MKICAKTQIPPPTLYGALTMVDETPQNPATPPDGQEREAGGPRYILETTLAILALIGFVFSAFLFFENRYAKDNHLTKVELGLELNGLADKLLEIQNQISKVEYELSTRENDEFFVGILKKFKEQENILFTEMNIIKSTMAQVD